MVGQGGDGKRWGAWMVGGGGGWGRRGVVRDWAGLRV